MCQRFSEESVREGGEGELAAVKSQRIHHDLCVTFCESGLALVTTWLDNYSTHIHGTTECPSMDMSSALGVLSSKHSKQCISSLSLAALLCSTLNHTISHWPVHHQIHSI